MDNALSKFVIGEWLECPSCGMVCDAPFRPDGSDANEPEVFLGQSLPDAEPLPEGEWQVKVSTRCPRCGMRLDAIAVFECGTLRKFGFAQ
jgi:hypothetical protein